jgi:hypothetical protein
MSLGLLLCKQPRRLWALLGNTVLAGFSLGMGYPGNEQIIRELQEIAAAHPGILRTRALLETPAGNAVWLAELGCDPEAKMPAMLAVGGIEGNDLLGSASLLRWVEMLAAGYESDTEVKGLLNSTTIYVIPRLNPDAADRFFTSPRVEVLVNTVPVDEDHDGLSDEDGPDDLDDDGLITFMRVKDPEGDYRKDPKEPRLLLKADRVKGETGEWKLYSEGVDNDGDEEWNEDPLGGVNYNRNFPYNFRFFESVSGLYPLSEEVTRKLADFVIAHPEISVVFTFGSEDNLLEAPKGEAPKRPPTAVHEADAPYLRELGKSWRQALDLKKELKQQSEPGTFASWVYFHRGRLSLAAQSWSPAIQLAVRAKQTDDQQKKNGAEDAGDGKKTAATDEEGKSKEASEERAFLTWIQEHAPEQFVDWKTIEHPDFPGRLVEVGGFAPFARSNPPEAHLETWTSKHAGWLTSVAQKLPRIRIRDVKVKALGNSVYDITVQVENTGYLPTAMAQGELTREVFPTRVELELRAEAVLSGLPRTTLATIPGSGGMREARFVVNGKGLNTVDVVVTSMLAGTVFAEVRLVEEN